jgi:cell division protein FtsA
MKSMKWISNAIASDIERWRPRVFEGGLVVALDIGTSRIRAAIGEYDEQSKLCLAGMASVASKGLRRGVIVNIESLIKLISKVVEEAEHQAGRTVEELWVSPTAYILEGLNSRGVVAVRSKDREIRKIDVDRVMEVARAIALPMDRKILHVIPQHFVVDDQPGIKDPLDMVAVRLGAEVHVVTAPEAALDNCLKAVNRSGFAVRAMVMDSLAASCSVLTHEEMDMGVLMLDIGSSSTGWILFQGGAPWKSGHIPLGGDQVSKDLSIVLKTPQESAEEIKCESGCCWEDLIEMDEPVIVPGVGGNKPIHVTQRELAMIISARIREMFQLIRDDMDLGRNIYRLSAGLVITGGGANLRGIAQLAGSVFDLPVRIGNPLAPTVENKDLGPEWSVLMGLVQYGDQQNPLDLTDIRRQKVGISGNKTAKKEGGMASAILNWLKEFV